MVINDMEQNINCDFNNIAKGTGNGVGCFIWEPNTWMTIYYKIHLGDLNGGRNSNVEAFVAMNGGPYIHWINVKNIPLSNDGSGLNRYDAVTLTNYMTGLRTAAPVVNAAPAKPTGLAFR